MAVFTALIFQETSTSVFLAPSYATQKVALDVMMSHGIEHGATSYPQILKALIPSNGGYNYSGLINCSPDQLGDYAQDILQNKLPLDSHYHQQVRIEHQELVLEILEKGLEQPYFYPELKGGTFYDPQHYKCYAFPIQKRAIQRRPANARFLDFPKHNGRSWIVATNTPQQIPLSLDLRPYSTTREEVIRMLDHEQAIRCK